MIRRIELYGGPGIGKTHITRDITSALSKAGIKTDLVQEKAKEFAYRKQTPERWDQLELFNSQLQREFNLLRYGVEIVVTDSPLFMNACYGYRYKFCAANHIYDMSRLFDEQYSPYRILLTRNDEWFKEHGRFQNLEEAKELDEFIAIMLKNNQKEHVVWEWGNINDEIDKLVKKIKGSNDTLIVNKRIADCEEKL